jgi:hypothetical protein
MVWVHAAEIQVAVGSPGGLAKLRRRRESTPGDRVLAGLWSVHLISRPMRLAASKWVKGPSPSSAAGRTSSTFLNLGHKSKGSTLAASWFHPSRTNGFAERNSSPDNSSSSSKSRKEWSTSLTCYSVQLRDSWKNSDQAYIVGPTTHSTSSRRWTLYQVLPPSLAECVW